MKLSEIKQGQFARVLETGDVIMGVENTYSSAAYWRSRSGSGDTGQEIVAVTIRTSKQGREGVGYLWSKTMSGGREIELVNVETEDNHAA